MPLQDQAALVTGGAGGLGSPLCEQAEQAVRKIVDRFGSIDVLLNNAGTDVTCSATEMEVTSWERVLQPNLHGPCVLALSHALHTELRPAGIKVAAVVAGGLLTPFLLDRFPDIDRMTLQDQDQAHVAFAICSVLELQAVTVVPESLLRHEAQRQLDLVASLGCRLASIRLGLRIGAAEFDAATGDRREGITRRAVNSSRRCCDCRFSCSFGSH